MRKLFEKYTVGERWGNMDSAIYSVGNSHALSGEYWFWLFTDIKTNIRLNLCVSKIGIPHLLNENIMRPKNLKDNNFKGSLTCWYYDGKSIETVKEEMCTVNISANKFCVNSSSGLNVVSTGKFPNYNIKVSQKESIADINIICSEFDNMNINEDLSIDCIESISKKKDGYFKTDITSKFPYMSAKSINLFSEYKGKIFDKSSSGFVYMERVRAFGRVPNWTILFGRFKDNSQIWFGNFMGLKQDYGFPLNFYFIEGKTGKKHQFTEYKQRYFDKDMKHSRKIVKPLWENAKFIVLEGKSKSARIKLTAEIMNRVSNHYCCLGSEARYHQLILLIRDLEFKSGKVKKTLKDLKSNKAYGEHSSYIALKGPWFSYTKARLKETLKK